MVTTSMAKSNLIEIGLVKFVVIRVIPCLIAYFKIVTANIPNPFNNSRNSKQPKSHFQVLFSILSP